MCVMVTMYGWLCDGDHVWVAMCVMVTMYRHKLCAGCLCLCHNPIQVTALTEERKKRKEEETFECHKLNCEVFGCILVCFSQHFSECSFGSPQRMCSFGSPQHMLIKQVLSGQQERLWQATCALFVCMHLCAFLRAHVIQCVTCHSKPLEKYEDVQQHLPQLYIKLLLFQ